MANHPAPLDTIILDLHRARRNRDDALADRAIRDLVAYRDRQRLAESIERGGDLFSDYMADKAARCGCVISRLEVDRREDTVIRMRPRSGGPDRAA